MRTKRTEVQRQNVNASVCMCVAMVMWVFRVPGVVVSHAPQACEAMSIQARHFGRFQVKAGCSGHCGRWPDGMFVMMCVIVASPCLSCFAAVLGARCVCVCVSGSALLQSLLSEMPPKSSAAKRKASLVVTKAKVSKLSEEYSAISARQEEAEIDLKIAEIVRELQAPPAKVKECHRAVFGTMFLPSQGESETFDETTIIWLYRLPRAFVERVLTMIKGDLPLETIGQFSRANRLVCHQLLYCATLTDKSSLLPDYNKERLCAALVERAKKVAAPLNKLKVSNLCR